MRRIGFLAGAAVMAAAGLLMPSGAQAYSCSNIVEEEVAGFYVLVGDDTNSVWVYEESNGNPGLQRGGDDTCATLDAEGNPVTPDTIIF